ncbi:MAG: hypothetical protein DU480_11860 [Nitrosomonas sp.]|uniref:hypothetical protein n=1 Tax=Nitrosomonas sp. TaxID=42353 RepID=UPI0032ED355C
MTRSDATVFNLTTIAEYLEFCSQAVDEFARDQANVLRGFSAILSLNHISDWIQYKLSAEQRSTLGISGKVGTSVKDYFEAKNEELALIRSIANGFKHLRPVHSTRQISGYGEGPFGIGPFGTTYLIIDKGEHFENAERWTDGLSLSKSVLEYWKRTLEPILEKSNYDRH